MADDEDMELALEELEEAAEAAFKRLGRDDREDDEIVEQSLMRAVRKAAEKVWRKRPLVDVSVLRI
jgi:ribonuclease J